MLKITRINKHNNKYTLEFSNGESLEVSERIVIDYLVSTSKEISMDEYYEIKEKNHYYELLDKMINTLIHKRLLTSEVKAYLKNEPAMMINCILEEVSKLHLVDDAKYIKDFIYDKANFNHYGKNKIYNLLLQKKAPKALVDKIFLNYDEELDRTSLRKLMEVELKAKKKDNKNHYFLKLKTSLINKGFESYLIDEVVSEYYQDLVANLLEEESIDKAILKYQNKYDKAKLKQKLYALGFSLELINEKLELLDD